MTLRLRAVLYAQAHEIEVARRGGLDFPDREVLVADPGPAS